MSDIKYLGVQGLEELIILTQNNLAKKADVLQFDVMPDPTKYIGKIVQYVGVSDISFTRSHFYYSNGTKWTEENTSVERTTKIEMVTALPYWADSDPQVLYILKNTADITMSFYAKNPSVNDTWFTVEKSASFVVVDSLPQWADADSSIVYFKANGNDLVGYIKNPSVNDTWYTLGGTGSEIIVDSDLSATSENPVQNKVIFTEVNGLRAQANMILTASQDADNKLRVDIRANSDALGVLNTKAKGMQQEINANGNSIYDLGLEVGDMHDEIRANSDALGALNTRADDMQQVITSNGNLLHDFGLEVGSMHDEISANQTEINTIKRNLLDTYATRRYVQNQNLLYDSEHIDISLDPQKPTRMEYDGYITVTVALNADTPTLLYINGSCAAYATVDNSGDSGFTVFVAKNDDLHITYHDAAPRNVNARFYKLRDYTNRPPKA